MKICKFCRKLYKSGQLKKRTVTLPTGLLITSLDPMCKACYDRLNNYQFKQETNDNTSRDTDTREVEGIGESTPTVEGQ